MPFDRLRDFCLLLALLALPATALAGPWEVGNTNPSKTKKIKLEFTGKYTATKDSYGIPVVKFAAPLADDLSFEIATGYGIVDKPPEGSRGGARDATAKLKWRVIDETDGRPALLLEPKFTFDTGDTRAGVGGGSTTLKMPIRAGKQFGPVRLTGEFFYTHDFDHDDEDILGYGGLIEYAPHERWVVGIDLLSDRPARDASRYHLRSNVAVKLKATPKTELQALIGRSLENRRGELATNVKFVASFKF